MTAAQAHEYVFINAFRALAAFWVLTYHCMIWGGMGTPALPSAKIAVDLFMMISGFLMAANATAREAREPMAHPRTWARFWTRRFFRIAPAYYLALAIMFALGPWMIAGFHELQSLNPVRWPAGGIYDPTRTVYDTGNLLLHVTFVFGLLPAYANSTLLPDWSLGLEMQFYLAFPLLLLALRRFGFAVAALALGAAALAGTVFVQRTLAFPEPSFLALKLQYFLAGMLMFEVVGVEGSERRRIGLAAAALLLVSLERAYGAELVVEPLLAAALLALGVLEVRGATPARLAALLGSRPVTLAADTSYAVYLFHGCWIAATGLFMAAHRELVWSVPSAGRVIGLFAFVTLASYASAYLVYRLVELPGIALGKTLLNTRLRAAPTVAPARVAGVVELPSAEEAAGSSPTKMSRESAA